MKGPFTNSPGLRYFVISNLAGDETQVIRYAAILRGTESAWQAVSYGLNAIPIFASVGGVYFNFLLWGLSLAPAWYLVKHFGGDLVQPTDIMPHKAEEQGLHGKEIPDKIHDHGFP